MLFLLYILYLEIVFGLSLTGISGDDRIITLTLFSVAYSGILYIITGIWHNKTVRHILKLTVMFLCPFPYLISFFIYGEFGVFYDLNTLTGGAGDALANFGGDIEKLVFSGAGMLFILLCMLPFFLYLIYVLSYTKYISPIILRCKGRVNRIPGGLNLLRVFEVSVIFYLLALIYITGSQDLSLKYGKEYSFESAINNFGLASAIRIEIKEKLLPSDDFGNSGVYDYGQNASSDTCVSGNTMAYAGWSQIEAELDGNKTVSANGRHKVSENSLPTVSGNTSQKTLPIAKGVDLHKLAYAKNITNIDFEALSADASKDELSLDSYVSGLPGTSKNRYTGLFQGMNLIFITAEAFTAEVIDEERTPCLYRLATKGINFTDYYQPTSAGTTGGEYSNLMGMLPNYGGKSMKMTAENLNYMTIGSRLNSLSYYGKAYHNNDYTYYDRDITHVNLGYSDGYMGYGNGMEQYVSAIWPESDLEMMEGTMQEYIDKEPFNVYYMSVSGHSLYDIKLNAMTKKYWELVRDLPYSDRVKSYLAAQTELDRALAYIVETLEQKGIADRTVIVISADHYPYGLDADSGVAGYPYLTELYGKPITNNFERDHNRLIIWSGLLENYEPIIVDEPTFSPDILPTLLNLFGVQYDSRLLPGRDVFSDAMPLVYDLGYNWKTEKGTFANGRFTPVSDETDIPKDYVKTIRQIVSDKINYSKKVVSTDYFRHIYKDE